MDKDAVGAIHHGVQVARVGHLVEERLGPEPERVQYVLDELHDVDSNN